MFQSSWHHQERFGKKKKSMKTFPLPAKWKIKKYWKAIPRIHPHILATRTLAIFAASSNSIVAAFPTAAALVHILLATSPNWAWAHSITLWPQQCGPQRVPRERGASGSKTIGGTVLPDGSRAYIEFSGSIRDNFCLSSQGKNTSLHLATFREYHSKNPDITDTTLTHCFSVHHTGRVEYFKFLNYDSKKDHIMQGARWDFIG